MISLAYMGQAYVYSDLKQNDKAVFAIRSASEGVDPAANFVVKSFFEGKKSTEYFKNISNYQPYKDVVNSILSKTIAEPEEHLTFIQSVLYGNNGVASIFMPKTAHAGWLSKAWKAVTKAVSQVVQTVADVFNCRTLDNLSIGGFMAKGCNTSSGTPSGGGGTTPSPTPIPPSINGVGDPNTPNYCSAGNLTGVSENSSSYSWACDGTNGGTSQTYNLRKPIAITSCSNNDATGINKDTTYSVNTINSIGSISYNWSFAGAGTNGGSSFTTTGYDTYGIHTGPTVVVTDSGDGKTAQSTCLAQVGCRGSRLPNTCNNGVVRKSSCVGTEWIYSTTTSATDLSCPTDGSKNTGSGSAVLSAPIKIVSFKFNPNTVESGKKCPLYIEAQNVTFCYVRNKYGQVSIQPDALTIIDNKIKISGTEFALVGTHKLLCLGLGADVLTQKDAIEQAVVVGTSTCYTSAVNTEK